MRCYDYPALGEKLYKATLENGLRVLVAPRPGFTKKLAYFVTDFGAIHRSFTLEGEEIQVPAGIAHFLEHKMFDLPDGRDVTAELAALGAGVNAFTSYDMTAYYFSCTEHFEEALRLLLEFVSTPHFTEESVEKELGIIDQEIGMSQDAPDSRVFENLAREMYAAHHIRTPILGSCQSLRDITPELLHTCHRAFYTPGNMLLCVVGDVEPDTVTQIANEILGTEKRPMGIKAPQPEEAPFPVSHSVTEAMEVAMPLFNLGFKSVPVGKGEAAIRREIVGDLAAELLFGESSACYLELYESGLIDSSFGGGFETVEDMAMLLCSGDSEDPAAVRDAILAHARRILAEGVEEGQFLRMKRSALGRRIRDLDSFDSTCFRLCAYELSDFDYYRFPEVYQKVTSQELLDFLKETVREDLSVLSVIEPV